MCENHEVNFLFVSMYLLHYTFRRDDMLISEWQHNNYTRLAYAVRDLFSSDVFRGATMLYCYSMYINYVIHKINDIF